MGTSAVHWEALRGAVWVIESAVQQADHEFRVGGEEVNQSIV